MHAKSEGRIKGRGRNVNDSVAGTKKIAWFRDSPSPFVKQGGENQNL